LKRRDFLCSFLERWTVFLLCSGNS